MKSFWLALPLASGACAAAIAMHAEPVLIYNPSNSVPSGFYLRANDEPGHGDFVTVAAADVAPAYAGLRDYADPTDKFLKRIAAVAGHHVCAEANTITIDGVTTVARAQHDNEGRLLPSWDGCHTLAAGEVFLLGDTEDSFDGRYWGPISTELIGGVWRPLSN